MKLGVNIDHVATVRQARRGAIPDPVAAALACVRGGADSIVCHLREDRRHIQDRDVQRLLDEIPVPLNLEMSIAPAIVRTAIRLRPRQVTLVPERRQELTTEGGLDVVRLGARLERVIDTFARHHIAVSLFVDPVAAQLEACARCGARLIELHTGGYATAPSARRRARELAGLKRAAVHARRLGLTLAAGHGLDYQNVQAVAAIPGIVELNIGFSIVSRALFVGMERAAREMRREMRRSA